MKENKLVSIILPVYNGERFLKEAIESVIVQTYQYWELIIVDDCSTDKTSEIAKSFIDCDNRIFYYRNKKNLKLPASLNVGFSLAKGEYYTWTSDDNVFKPNAIEKMVEAIELNESIAMVYADFDVISEDGDILDSGYTKDADLLIQGNVFGACFLYRASIAREIGPYDVTLFLAEDYDYWIRIHRIGEIRHINEKLYFYRKNLNSLTETKKSQIVKQTYAMLEKHFLYFYFFSKRTGQQYVFFDYMLEKAGSNRQKILKMFNRLEHGYSWYLFRKKMNSTIKETILWKTLRNIKRLIMN